MEIGAAELDADSILSPYTVSIHLHGNKSSELKDLLRIVSTTAADADRPPPTLTLLGSIAKSDIEKMEKVLRAKSFYSGTVKFNFKEQEEPLRLIFSITTGNPFLLNDISVDISGTSLPEDVTPPDAEETGLKKGARGTSASIIAGGDRLLAHIRKQGYPFVDMADRRVVVDYANETIDVTFTLAPGERAVFGKTKIEGLEDVDEEYVRKKIPWREDQFYNPALIQEFRNRLSRTGLFTMVLIPPLENPSTQPPQSPTPSSPSPTSSSPSPHSPTPSSPSPHSPTPSPHSPTPSSPSPHSPTPSPHSPTPSPPSPTPSSPSFLTPQPSSTATDGAILPAALLPVTVNITVRERDRHTVGVMAGYSTDLGAGGGLSWEDRNLFGEGESLRINLFGSEKMYMVEGRFMLPEFLSPNQSLTLGIQPVYDNPDAYTSYRVRASAVVRNNISERFSFSGGVALTTDRVEQLDQTNDYILLSVPLNAQLSVGGSQPFRRGGAIFSILGEPYWDLHSDRLFVKIVQNTNLLYRFPWASDLSAVGRISLGSIPEAEVGDVPADLRFYAGGANSIRGYAYQIVGPMSGKDPIGGRSLLTISLEFDLEIIGEFGAAAFIDGGSAFADSLPDPGEKLLWGTGVGLRYFTPIGPIGVDIGFPLDKRKGIDDDYQVYVSIAQIF
jgi:outer membrane translocation and assembly module TamA